jgi:hypothetical protein
VLASAFFGGFDFTGKRLTFFTRAGDGVDFRALVVLLESVFALRLIRFLW